MIVHIKGFNQKIKINWTNNKTQPALGKSENSADVTVFHSVACKWQKCIIVIKCQPISHVSCMNQSNWWLAFVVMFGILLEDGMWRMHHGTAAKHLYTMQQILINLCFSLLLKHHWNSWELHALWGYNATKISAAFWIFYVPTYNAASAVCVMLQTFW